jgi:transcription termination factor Rho
MARHVFVVSRHHARLYEYLLERFQGDKNVEIVLDRRVAERRTGGSAPSTERRLAERRQKRPEDDLVLRSHIIITLPD